MATFADNHINIGKGFTYLLEAMAPYIAQELKNAYGDNWWQAAVLDKLYEDQARDLPQAGADDDLIKSLDIARSLVLVCDVHWRDIFGKQFPREYKSWAKELQNVRNKWAHAGQEEFDDSYTWRALDTMARLCEPLDADNAEKIKGLLRLTRYGSEAGSRSATVDEVSVGSGGYSKSEGMLHASPDGLPAWRDVMTPHADVAKGDYIRAEFAADLAQVERGQGAFEYRDPVEFFSRTYITEGMRTLLVQALRRVSAGTGEPVIQLKTAFGGGKTHSMLALYHLLHGRLKTPRIDALNSLLEEADISEIPQVHTAVFVGTALDPSKSKRPPNMPGITINTAWGEIAAQLAFSAGDPKIYDLVREADKKGTSPGSRAFQELFDRCGSCLVLMDELVAYARKLYETKELLPAGSFDTFLTFIQEITEGAKNSKQSLVVASIPESKIEIGGEAGVIALQTIEHTFGRMEAVWKPVNASEGFEIVRRRLFNPCRNPDARRLVCNKFSDMYRENSTDFSSESKELEYRNRLESCYPIHPEVFDRLYEDWATLENFQRTRGVLRLMAAVIHELWMGKDQSLLIMPGSLPFDVPNVRDELTRHLPANWNPIVDTEVDGRNSVPYKKDQENARFGKSMASRRIARTILLGSAPTSAQQRLRGIEVKRILLGTVQPGELIAVFNDALNTLHNSLSYLYATQAEDRFWFDTRPTLRKTAADREQLLKPEDIQREIEKRLEKLCSDPSFTGPFAGVHVCPANSLDVPDTQSVRLVVLPPQKSFTPREPDCAVKRAACDFLENRGDHQRKYRNMLVFLAAGQSELSSLEQCVRKYLAWESIYKDKETLNLDSIQRSEALNNLKNSEESVNQRLNKTWCWLLIPGIEDRSNIENVVWEGKKISVNCQSIVSIAAKKLCEDADIIEVWGPQLLLDELNKLLWKDNDNISVETLWDYLCTYGYLPRLANFKVLRATIEKGVSEGLFGYAKSLSDGGVPVAVVLKEAVEVATSGYLVKKDVAENLLKTEGDDIPDNTDSEDENGDDTTNNDGPGNGGTDGTDDPDPKKQNGPTRFQMNIKLEDQARIVRNVSNIVDEILSHLTNEGMELQISLDVIGTSKNAISEDTVRIVSDNCSSLKIKEYGFDE